MLFKEIYKGKKVFLTGHTGFKGSWILSWLNMAGANVVGYSLAPKPEHKLFGLIKGERLCNSIFGNILDYSTLEKVILDFQPDFVFHLAAQPLVRFSYEEPLDTFNTNIIGTANILNVIRKVSKPCIAIMVTTDKVYQNNETMISYKESDRLGGYDPYSASKACAELVINSYRNSFFNPHNYGEHNKKIASVRAGNVIGGGDWAKNRIVPDIVKALENNESITIRNPKSVRPWQHVVEPIHAYLLLGEKLFENNGSLQNEYNFGPEDSDCLTVEAVVKCAIEIWQSGSYQISEEKKSPHEAGMLKLNTSRAKLDLNWRPIYSAYEALGKTISWYKVCNTINALELVKKDILDFTLRYNETSEK